MKTIAIFSLAALCAQAVLAFPSPEAVSTDVSGSNPAVEIDALLDYYCSIPGKCAAEPTGLAARSADPWRWNYCRLPGQPCIEKVKRSAEPWRWNYCRLPGQPCIEKNKRGVVTGFPGSEALDDDATAEDRALADKYKEIAEKLFG